MEAESAAMCRICLESNNDSGGCTQLLCDREGLIAPCQCRGTHQFVHRSCLDRWRSSKEGFAFAHCTTCKAQYHLRIVEGNCWSNIHFHMVVARDILLVFFAIQAMIALLGGLSYLCDLNGKLRNSFGHGLGRIFLNHPVLFYYCFGALLFLALLGIYGLFRLCISTQSSSSGHRSNGSIYCCCWNDPISIDCMDSDSDNAALCCALMLMVVIIFAFIGIFYGIYAGAIEIQSIWKKHYHILTKRELTKEYLVEDLHGCYTTPNLDRGHEEQLRMLGLL